MIHNGKIIMINVENQTVPNMIVRTFLSFIDINENRSRTKVTKMKSAVNVPKIATSLVADLSATSLIEEAIFWT